MSEKDDPFFTARREMVERQLRGRGVEDERVLGVMERVPREHFVRGELRDRAYEDAALPSEEGQTISQPYMVGLMTSELNVREGDSVLEIGTGTGYQAAILAHLTDEVFTIERVPGLAMMAAERLRALGLGRVHVLIGDGTRGWPAPESGTVRFERILVTAGAPGDVEPLLEQLRPGGLMVIPEGSADDQMLMVLRKNERGEVEKRDVTPCRFVPLIGEYGWARRGVR